MENTIKKANLNVIGTMGNFDSVSNKWEKDNVKPKSFELVVVDSLEKTPFSAGDSFYSTGHWKTNVYVDGDISNIHREYSELYDSYEPGIDFNVEEASYVALEHYGGSEPEKNDRWYYTVYTDDEEKLKEIVEALGGFLGLFNPDDCSYKSQGDAVAIYKRQKIKNKSL